MKIVLELNVIAKNSVFLNFWNSRDGRDVVCTIRDGKLFCKGKEITLDGFIRRVIRRSK